MWDFWSLNPESLHQVIILMSNRGTPMSYRHMHGFGSHTFSMINHFNERTWVKFHFRTQQDIKNFTGEDANTMRGIDPDQAQRDLVEAIAKKEFPKWLLQIQVMTEDQAIEFEFNPFDVTKIWPHKEYPLIDVGMMELHTIPENYFRDVEQAAFAPAHVVNGISYSPDKMLQGRILSYPDAQRYRLGANYEHIPVNKCPYMTSNYQRDGLMQVSENGGADVNYRPNSYDDMIVDSHYKEPSMILESHEAGWYDRNVNDGDHYSQPAKLVTKVMTDLERSHLIDNIVNSMKGIIGEKKEEIIYRQLCNFFRVDMNLGVAIAKGLGIELDEKIMSRK